MGQTIPASDNTGSIYLYQTIGCTKYVNSVLPTSAQAICSLITTGNLPSVLGYMKDASNVAIAFTILSLLVNIISLFFMCLIALKKLSMVFSEEGAYKVRYCIVGSNLIVMLFNTIAFASFSGLFNAKFQLNTDAMMIGFGGAQNRSWSYGGGFGLSIVVSILTGCIAVAEYLHKRDQGHLNTMMNPMNPHPNQTRQAAV
jgi:hypothetical protein